MSDSKKTVPPLEIPKEAQEQARSLIKGAFELFTEQHKRLAEDLAEFNKKREEVHGRIQRGARRTSGRIV